MRKLQHILSVIPLLLFVDFAHAGDKEDVLATLDAIKAAWTASDVDGAQKHHVAEFDMFQSDGSLLQTVDWEGMRAAFAAGLKFNVQTHHSEVTIYGDTPIITEYHTRQLTPPGGTPFSMTLRLTLVWVKQNGQWKGVHVHASHLTPKNPE